MRKERRKIRMKKERNLNKEIKTERMKKKSQE
jgi:hypothetical protein